MKPVSLLIKVINFLTKKTPGGDYMFAFILFSLLMVAVPTYIYIIGEMSFKWYLVWLLLLVVGQLWYYDDGQGPYLLGW